MSEATNFLKLVEERLANSQFHISRGVALPGGVPVGLVASRTYFSRSGFSYVSQHLLVAGREHVTADDLQSLFDAGFKYAKSVNRLPLFRGMLFGYQIMPCIAATVVDEAAIEYMRSEPRKRFALIEFPAIHDLSSGQTHYYRGSAVWGGLYFAEMKAVVRQFVEGDGRA